MTMDHRNRSREGVFVLTDPPPTFDFGIDVTHFETGDRFTGVCLIPPGIHFIYYSTGMGCRVGFFMEFGIQDVHVKSWNARNEEMVDSTLSEQALANLHLALNTGNLDAHLGPYPLAQHSTWCNISKYVTVRVLQAAGVALEEAVHPGDLDDNSTATSTTRVATFTNIANLRQNLVRHMMQEGKSSSEITAVHRDTSAIIMLVLQHKSIEDILGEIQLSFILFMFLYSFPALQAWKQLITALSSAEAFLHAHSSTLLTFIHVLYTQLNFCPVDFFEEEISRENFLTPVLLSLLQSLSGCEQTEDVLEYRRRFENFVDKKFNISAAESCELDYVVEEEQPVIVAMEQTEELRPSHEPPNSMSHITEQWHQIDIELSQHTPGTAAPQRNGNTSPINIEYMETKSSPCPLVPMSRNEIEAQMFCWRYPNLYEVMASRIPPEDLVMTATRLLDEVPEDSDAPLASARREALRYLEDEVNRQNSIIT